MQSVPCSVSLTANHSCAEYFLFSFLEGGTSSKRVRVSRLQAGGVGVAAGSDDRWSPSSWPPVSEPREAHTPRSASLPPHPRTRALARGPAPASPPHPPHLVHGAPLRAQQGESGRRAGARPAAQLKHPPAPPAPETWRLAWDRVLSRAEGQQMFPFPATPSTRGLLNLCTWKSSLGSSQNSPVCGVLQVTSGARASSGLPAHAASARTPGPFSTRGLFLTCGG